MLRPISPRPPKGMTLRVGPVGFSGIAADAAPFVQKGPLDFRVDFAVASRFLEEVPPALLEDIGAPRRRDYAAAASSSSRAAATNDDYASTHFDYENEDQRPSFAQSRRRAASRATHPTYNSIDNIAEFFAARGKRFTRPKVEVPVPTGRTGFRPGQRVRHPKYGEGTVFKREGDGEDAKITVQFSRFGLKKLVEKYAQLERC